MQDTITVVESQPDWLTAACHHRENTWRLARLALELIDGERQAGARVRPFRLQGYVGQQAGRVRYGERENAGLVQLSGDLARQHLEAVRGLQDSLTRIDIATTVQLPTYDPEVGRRAFAQAIAHRTEHPRSALPSQTSDADGGYTLYLGDRTANYYLRLYNKQAERLAAHDSEGAEQYARCWRVELECKGGPAPMLAKLVDEHPDPSGYIQSYLHTYLAEHGVTPIFPPSGCKALKPGFTRRSDRAKTLSWFRTAVAPGIRRLLADAPGRDVYDALGLPVPSDLAQTSPEL